MTLREYKIVSQYQNAFIEYCTEQAILLGSVNNTKVSLLCDAVQMKALVVTYDGKVLGKYEYQK